MSGGARLDNFFSSFNNFFFRFPISMEDCSFKIEHKDYICSMVLGFKTKFNFFLPIFYNFYLVKHHEILYKALIFDYLF